MRLVAARIPRLTLSEVISLRYVAICWSQTPFAAYEPTAEVFAAVGGGNPTVEMVWKHLEYLANISRDIYLEQMTDFLKDLHATYTDLQSRIDQCKDAFESRRGKKLWLNIATARNELAVLTEVKDSWVDIGGLNTSILWDAGSVQAIKASLTPYDRLLRALGCESIIWPAVTLPVSDGDHSAMAGVRNIRTKKRLLFDIKFKSEGREIRAHILILAATSEKWMGHLTSGLNIEDEISYNKLTDKGAFIPYHALSTMIDFAYEETINWGEMQASPEDDEVTLDRKLHKLLDLHKAADCWGVPQLMVEAERMLAAGFKLFINVQNVEEIRRRADEARAMNMESACKEFIFNNVAVVVRASGRATR